MRRIALKQVVSAALVIEGLQLRYYHQRCDQ